LTMGGVQMAQLQIDHTQQHADNQDADSQAGN